MAVGVGGIVLSKKLEVLPVNGGVVVREVWEIENGDGWMDFMIAVGVLLNVKILSWSKLLIDSGELEDDEDASCVRGSVWWVGLRIGGGVEVFLIIAGGR